MLQRGATLIAPLPSVLPCKRLLRFFTDLLAVALACEGFLHALLFTWLQVEGMALHFLDDVFSLHLALKTAQSILKGFAFLNSNFCQWGYTSEPA